MRRNGRRFFELGFVFSSVRLCCMGRIEQEYSFYLKEKSNNKIKYRER